MAMVKTRDHPVYTRSIPSITTDDERRSQLEGAQPDSLLLSSCSKNCVKIINSFKTRVEMYVLYVRLLTNDIPISFYNEVCVY